MITASDNPSLGWIGANPSLWFGAINPLPDDFAIGTFQLTLTNVIDGSNVQIELQGSGATVQQYMAGAGITIYDAETLYDASTAYDSQASTEITLSVYKVGSVLNDLRVKVRKGTSAPYYQPYETLVTASTTPISIYVSQIPDE